MDDYTESELYSIFANVGYQIQAGMSFDEIENQASVYYGVDFKIDKELSDNYGAIIRYGDEIIHSVRGTDPTVISDLVSDLNLVVASPYISTLTSAIEGGLFGWQSAQYFNQLFDFEALKLNIERMETAGGTYSELIMAKIKQSLDRIKTLLGFKSKIPEIPLPPKMSFGFGQPNPAYLEWEAKYGHLIEELNPTEFLPDKSPNTIKSILSEKKKLSELIKQTGSVVWKRVNRALDAFIIVDLGLKIMNHVNQKNLKYVGTFARRRLREENRLNSARAKYNKKFSLTGHSLGGLVNDLGRTYKLKSISFNPAPMEHNSSKPHPDSRIYKTNADPISFFLTSNDKEPIIRKDSNSGIDLLHAHKLDHFLPRRNKRTMVEEQETVEDAPLDEMVEDYKPEYEKEFDEKLDKIISDHRRQMKSIDDALPKRSKTIDDEEEQDLEKTIEEVITTYKLPNKQEYIRKKMIYEQLAKKHKDKELVNMLNEYSGIFEDSIEEFLPNYQRQELSFIHKNKFKHKLKKKYIFSI